MNTPLSLLQHRKHKKKPSTKKQTNCLFFTIPYFTENILFIAFLFRLSSPRMLHSGQVAVSKWNFLVYFLVPLMGRSMTIEEHPASNIHFGIQMMFYYVCCALISLTLSRRSPPLPLFSRWVNIKKHKKLSFEEAPAKRQNKYPTRMPSRWSSLLSIWHELFNVFHASQMWIMRNWIWIF